MKSKTIRLTAFVLFLFLGTTIHLAACEKHQQAALATNEHKHGTREKAVSEKAESCACSAGQHAQSATSTEQPEEAAPARGYPLRGVVVDVLPEKGGLLVKHEEVPGVMKAMTMLLKVDETTLKTVRKDQAITGLLARRSDGWWLFDVTAEK